MQSPIENKEHIEQGGVPLMSDGNFDFQSFIDSLKVRSKISEEVLKHIVEIATIHRVSKGQIILKAGQYNNRIYVLVSGTVDIVHDEQHIYSSSRTGNIFGEISTMTGGPSPKSIIAKTDVVVLSSSEKDLKHLNADVALQAKETFYRMIAGSLAEKLQRSTTQAGDLKRQNVELNSDSLTGCWNQNKFFADLPSYKVSALLYLKIDKFNEINDGLGFEAGNHVLVEVSSLIRGLLPEGASIYRFSGSEFGVLVPDTQTEALHLAEVIKDEVISAHITYRNSRVVLTISVGVADHETGDLFRNAHLALGEAKKTGKIVIYNQELNTQVKYLESLQQFKNVQEAFENNMFFPVFQGIRDNRKDSPTYGTLSKYECLIRLQTNEKELAPYFFIRALERSGEITRATKVMIMKSFDYMAQFKFDFSVNLTEKDLLAEDTVDFIEYQLEGNKIDPKRVTFEILEGVSTAGSKAVLTTLLQLKSFGCKIAIDDFGAEQSNISRLLDFEPDYIKIDAKFIKHIATDKKSRLIVENIYDLATRMKAEVVAEFVENEEIQHVIDEIGIQFSQGYLFAKPIKQIT